MEECCACDAVLWSQFFSS